VDYLDRLERELRDDLKDEMDKLRGLVGPEISAVEADGKTFSPLSAAHVGELLYRHLDLPELSSAKRSLATDRATLTKLSSALRNHPDYARALEAIEIILSYRYTHKLLATYLVNIRKAMDAEGRLHFNFNLHTTSSGRLSSSDPINIQNWPKRRGTEIRDLFVATPGYTLVESDLSQAEIRVAAALSGDPALISVVAAGGDMHRNNAAKIFQKKPEDVTESERQLGKAVSFAVLYGADAPKVSEITRLPLSQAEEVIKSFFSAYPRLSEWIAEVERRVKNGEPVVTPFHRRRRVDWLPESGKERGDVIRSVVNFPVQSTASDITLSALIRIGREIDWQRTRLLITVHDSILAETMDDPVEVGGWLAATMVSCSPFPDVPFEAEVKVGERWGSLHELKSR
jgi:DNA polymerase-1